MSTPLIPGKPNSKKPCLVYIACKKCGHRNGPYKPASMLRQKTAVSKASKLASQANGKKGGRPKGSKTVHHTPKAETGV